MENYQSNDQKRGFTLPKYAYKYVGPYNPLEKQLEYNDKGIMDRNTNSYDKPRKMYLIPFASLDMMLIIL